MRNLTFSETPVSMQRCLQTTCIRCHVADGVLTCGSASGTSVLSCWRSEDTE